ncbi:MAG: hypothetical protein V1776_00225 [Candidatus Diapherotrites archaeon]
MSRRTTITIGLLLILIISMPLLNAATTATTTFTFNVPSTRSITITYGGSCAADAFFFVEGNAQYDPDDDGNAAKVRPTANRNETTEKEYNYQGVTSPSSTYYIYDGNGTGKPPTNNNTPTTEFNTSEYDAITVRYEVDGEYAYTGTSGIGNAPTARFVVPIAENENTVSGIRFDYAGDAHGGAAGCPSAGGGSVDINMFIWNYNSGTYEAIASLPLEQFSTGLNIRSFYGEIYGDMTPYIASDQNVTLLIQGYVATSGAGIQCLFSDLAYATIYYGANFCQDNTLSPYTITNTGNVVVNIDGNFTSAFSGSDANIVLKAWMGTGNGCGTWGMGGWEEPCSVTGTTNPITSTACKKWDSGNATIASRLITGLGAEDTNQLCFSGDFNGFVSAGDHNKVFQAGADYS